MQKLEIIKKIDCIYFRSLTKNLVSINFATRPEYHLFSAVKQ
jgi:hypothetical protein